MKLNRPRAIDLFCGVGGMSLGFEQAGFDVVAAFDLEPFNIATHKKNFADTKAFSVDLTKESGDSLRSLAKFDDELDLVFGGPPCQGFSIGGTKNADDERNLLLFDYARLVRQLQPKYFVMENVKGLMSERSKPILDSFLRRIRKAGYNIVTPIKVLNAADYGVPQRRWRTIVLGYRNDVAPLSYPEPYNVNVTSSIVAQVNVRDAISDLPILEDFAELFESDICTGKLLKANNAYAKLMRGLLIDPTDKSRPRAASKYLTGCLRTLHSRETVKRFSKTRPGSAEPISRFIRLAWDSVAPTIRAGTGRDHGNHTAPRPIHPEVHRCISTREAARLHSFPDWFQFHGTRWQDFRQIGNSVPPLLARAVAKEIFKLLLEE
jgi:DNA (cytosine-5)-methyltransferase 1